MTARRLTALTALTAALFAPRAEAATTTYAGGSLIIPQQGSFQDQCGLASAYGLMYKTLQANDWLTSQGLPRITVHWAYSATKGSPNRCTPTNIQYGPLYGSYTTGQPPPWNDPNWNDGCDFQITDTTSVPVTLVNNQKTASTFDTNVVTLVTTLDTNINPDFTPTAPGGKAGAAVTIQHTSVATTNVTTVQYMGGPFVIAAADATNFLNLLNGTYVATDQWGNTIDFTPYRTPATGLTAGNGTCKLGGGTVTHYVYIHRAQTSFTAPENLDINATPYRAAVLETASDGSSVANGILEAYLTNAGLDFPTAGGCPPGGYNVGNKAICPNGAAQGAIFDSFDVSDFAKNLEFAKDANGKPLYGVIWTPHWDVGTKPSATGLLAISSMSTFLDSATGLFGECASIASYEGRSSTIAAPASQFQTCVQNPLSPGACSSTLTTTAGLNTGVGGPSGANPNCTDPNLAAGSKCYYFSNPGDSFVQIGDHEFNGQGGSVTSYLPNTATSAIYKPGVLPLVSGVSSLVKADLVSPTAARAMITDEESTRNVKNGQNGGNIIYLAGHSYSSDPAGNRIVLGTLLELGLVLTTAQTGYTGPTYYSYDGTTAHGEVVVPTYNRIVSTPSSPAVKQFNPGAGSQFVFPYHSGNVQSHLLNQLAQGNDKFSASIQYDAAQAMPAPGARNVFTYLGGSLTSGMGSLIRQTGWTPVDFDYTSIQSPKTTCVDKFGIGTVAANPATNKPGPYFGMVAGADGVCDLEEVLAENLVLNTSSLATPAAVLTTLQDTTAMGAVQTTQAVTQLVRGYCYATVGGADGSGNLITHPTASQCNFSRQNDTAEPGGFVHSQVAVVPASTYISDAPTGKHRPTVAYAGGLDGQIHAFYVPSDGNDSGYSGTAVSPPKPFTSAKTVFHTDYLASGSFSPPAAFTELWSFIPPGQLPFLYTNDAQVDSAPAVLDVFGDFTGSGLRSWHTVLVASAGGSNREIFALDVTNPLSPQMIWDIQSSFDPSLPYAPVVLMDDDTGLLGLPNEQAFTWQNHCTQASVLANTCTAAQFALPPVTDKGRLSQGLFNYVDLGGSQSVSAGVLRRNNEPLFAAYVATNQPGGQGIFVFAIDITNGQKIWEFNNPYDKGNDPAGMASGLDNTPPTGVSLYSKANTGIVDTVYVGDMEGTLFELDAQDGLNNTSYAYQITNSAGAQGAGISCSAEGSCNYGLVNTYGINNTNNWPQPITTQETIFVVPSGVPSTSPFYNYRGQPLLAFGTAGLDIISALAVTPPVTGAVHVISLSQSARYTANQVIGPPQQVTNAQNKGVEIAEITGYPDFVTSGERLYGSITAAGNQLFFATTSGTVNNIDTRGTLTGSTYGLSLAASSSNALVTLTNSAGGAAGTTLVVPAASAGNVQVITVTDQQINVSAPVSDNTAAPLVNGVGKTPSGFTGWFFRSTGAEF